MLKICAVGIVAVIIIILVKQYKPELATGVSICASVIMLFFIIGSLKEGFDFISDLYGRLSYGKEYFPIILKAVSYTHLDVYKRQE